MCPSASGRRVRRHRAPLSRAASTTSPGGGTCHLAGCLNVPLHAPPPWPTSSTGSPSCHATPSTAGRVRLPLHLKHTHSVHTHTCPHARTSMNTCTHCPTGGTLGVMRFSTTQPPSPFTSTCSRPRQHYHNSGINNRRHQEARSGSRPVGISAAGTGVSGGRGGWGLRP